MADKILKLEPPSPVIVEKPFINAMIYGPPGSGKTMLAATMADHPDTGEVLFINIEAGLLSLGNRKGCSKVPCPTFEHLEAYFWKIVNKDKGFEKFNTVVIDSGTEFQALDLEELAKDAYDKDVAKNFDKAKRESRDELFQQDYGRDSTRLRRLFRWFRDAPINVVITALSKKIYSKPAVKDAEPQLLEVVPSFTDKLGQSLMGQVDFVWYLYHDEEKNVRKLLTRNKGVFKAKTRGPKFAEAIGEVVENPDLSKLYEMMKKHS